LSVMLVLRRTERLAMFAIRKASSRVSSFVLERRTAAMLSFCAASKCGIVW
jgi:hypothetical protein